MKQSLKELIASDDLILGTWSQIAAPEMIDLIGLNGFSFAIIDCEHGFFGMETAENLARACAANDIAAAVRVPVNDPVVIMKALDAGIRHVVIPNVSTREAAETAVAAARFGPHGLRGACPCCRSGGHFIRDWQSYVVEEESRTGIIALVETLEGYKNFSEIAEVGDLAAFMFGPFDLSVSMGLNGDWRNPTVLDAVREMVAQAVNKGHRVMMPVFSPDPGECSDLIADWRERGVDTFVIGSDKIIVANAFSQWVGALQS